MTPNYRHTLVLGAGIAGLGAAYELEKAGAEYLILEAASHAGGVLQSKETQGYTLDLGANSFAFNSNFENFIQEIGLDNALLPANESASTRCIYHQGALHLLKGSPLSALKSSLLTFPEKLRALCEPLIPVGSSKEESVAAFFSRRLGKGATQKLVSAALRGIYGGEIERLSIDGVLPQLKKGERKYGSLLAYMRKEGKKAAGSRKIYSLNGGMSVLGAAAKSYFSRKLKFQTQVVEITHDGKSWIVEVLEKGSPRTYSCKQLVCAIPSHQAVSLFAKLPEINALLSKIEYKPMGLLYLGFQKSQVPLLPEAFGFLVPENEPLPFLGVMFNSKAFPLKAPDGKELITVFHQHSGDTQTLTDQFMPYLSKVLQIQGDPEFMESYSWLNAIPQPVLGFPEIKRALEAYASKDPSLKFVGNYMGEVAVAKLFSASGL